MGKPDFSVYERFHREFVQYDKQFKTNQFVVPYFITGHPGCTLSDAITLSEYIRDHGAVPEQVQDFYPTPGSIATAMYYTGYNPFTMESMHIPKDREKLMQRALIQYNRPENYKLVHEALIKAGRRDLIGSHKGALIPEKPRGAKMAKGKAPEKKPGTRGKNKRKNGGKNGNGKKTNRIN